MTSTSQLQYLVKNVNFDAEKQAGVNCVRGNVEDVTFSLLLNEAFTFLSLFFSYTNKW